MPDTWIDTLKNALYFRFYKLQENLFPVITKINLLENI